MRNKRRKLQLTGFTIVVLLILGWQLVGGHRAPKQELLFGKGQAVTLYVKTEAGEEPVVDWERYFPEEDYDPQKFSCQIPEDTVCTPGVYEIPVFYDGKETGCQIELTVEEQKKDREETAVSWPEDGEILAPQQRDGE